MSCSPYFNLNSTTAELEYKILSVGDLFDLQNDSAKQYDQSFLLIALTDLNLLVTLARQEYDYPMLYDRLNSGPISTTEYADFLIATGTTQSMVQALNPNQLSITALQYLENLNTYYTNNFSSSTDGFCTIFSGVLNDVFNALNTVNNVIGAILNIQKLIETLIDTLKEKLSQLVTQLIQQVSNCLGSIKGIANTVQQTSDFFSDLNIQTLKDTVNGVIASTSNKFTNITQQNIEYLVYRFCQLSNAVEQFMRSPLSELQNALQSCTDVKNVLTNASTEFSLSAVTAGAFRMSDDNVEAVKKQLSDNLNNGADSGLDQAGQAKPGKWYTRPFTETEKATAIAIISAAAADILTGNHPGTKWFDFSTIGGSMNNPTDAIGVKKLTVDILILGMRISEKLGKKLSINSGYRSPAYNRSIGGAKNSYHMSGMALDVARSSFGTDFESGEKFIKAASEEGAMGIGTYSGGNNNFIHIDVRDYRSQWTETSGPLAHTNALKLHFNDQFRNGSSAEIDQLNADVRAALRT
jgi:vacuolar-type H+-ATPase subunit D/Vma8